MPRATAPQSGRSSTAVTTTVRNMTTMLTAMTFSKTR